MNIIYYNNVWVRNNGIFFNLIFYQFALCIIFKGPGADVGII